MSNEGNEKMGEKAIEEMRKRFSGYVVPEFDRVAQSDPDFMAWMTDLSKFCLSDGKALPAKYRIMIHIILLSHAGHVRALPHHIKNAIEKHGATKLELIEAFETALPAGGVSTLVRAMAGLIGYEEKKGYGI